MNKYLSSVIGLFAIVVLMSACNDSSESKLNANEIVKNPRTASGINENVKMPVISFETTEHDFGQLMLGELVTYSFKFENKGTADLLISSVEASCGCTIAKWNKEPIKPGETDYISVSYDSSGRRGVQNKVVSIMTNTQPSKTQLRIKANVMIP
ncbi:MAG: DUF1573 domain-containing protein [Bacteroidales bacterium]|nr:DUF1573 domain-containing protein [Bacteroidales bacterium]